VHYLCRIAWKILHQSVACIEYGNRPNPGAVQRRVNRLTRQLRQLGYHVQLTSAPPV
jgi:hypothetical protein